MTPFLELANWRWIFASPQEMAPEQRVFPGSRLASITVGLSSLLSAVLADVLLDSSRRPLIGVLWVSQIVMLAAWMGVTFYILRLAGPRGASQTISFWSWMTLCLWAWIPLHLLWPAALCAQIFGKGAVLVWSVCKLIVYTVIFRRWVVGIESFFGWPGWAAVLLVVSPWLIGTFFFIFFAAMAFSVLLVLTLGLVR